MISFLRYLWTTWNKQLCSYDETLFTIKQKDSTSLATNKEYFILTNKFTGIKEYITRLCGRECKVLYPHLKHWWGRWTWRNNMARQKTGMFLKYEIYIVNGIWTMLSWILYGNITRCIFICHSCGFTCQQRGLKITMKNNISLATDE